MPEEENGNQNNANNVDPTPEGPGAEPSPLLWIIFITAYLITLAGTISFFIYNGMPTCEPNKKTITSQLSSLPANQNNANVGVAAGNQSNANVNAAGNQNTAINPTNQNSNQAAGVTPIPTATPATVASSPAGGTPPVPMKVLSVSPASGPIYGDTLVIIRGTGLNNPKQVVFGGVPVKNVVAASSEGVTVQTAPHAAEKVDVAVIGADGRSDILQTAFTYTCYPLDNDNLFIMVLLAGALGAVLHAMRSFFWYVGNRTFIKSWTLMYILLPFVGAIIAAVFFLIILAGLLTPNSAANRETHWFILAVAVLAGLFSQQAALKLQNIINAALTTPGPGEDSKPQNTSSTGENKNTQNKPEPKPQISPDHGPKEGGVKVTIKGIKSKTVDKLFFAAQELTKDIQYKFDSDKGVIEFKTPAHVVAEEVDVKVVVNPTTIHTLKYKCE
jgi:hypothetical protein